MLALQIDGVDRIHQVGIEMDYLTGPVQNPGSTLQRERVVALRAAKRSQIVGAVPPLRKVDNPGWMVVPSPEAFAFPVETRLDDRVKCKGHGWNADIRHGSPQVSFDGSNIAEFLDVERLRGNPIDENEVGEGVFVRPLELPAALDLNLLEVFPGREFLQHGHEPLSIRGGLL